MKMNGVIVSTMTAGIFAFTCSHAQTGRKEDTDTEIGVLDGDTDIDTHTDTDTDTGADTNTDTDTDTEVPLGCEGPLEFADPPLEAVVRGAIGKANGDIFYDDVNELSRLSAYRADIHDLTGIECLTNLTILDLSNNLISDITMLSGLTHLNALYLDFNAISGIAVLSGLTDLYNLYLYSNRISDIAPIVANEGIQEQDTVLIYYNLLDCNDPTTQEDLATLIERGVDISDDCD